LPKKQEIQAVTKNTNTKNYLFDDHHLSNEEKANVK